MKEAEKNLENMFPTEKLKFQGLKTMLGAAAALAGFIVEIREYINVPKEIAYQMALTASYLAPLLKKDIKDFKSNYQDLTAEDFEYKYKKILEYIIELDKSYEENT